MRRSFRGMDISTHARVLSRKPAPSDLARTSVRFVVVGMLVAGCHRHGTVRDPRGCIVSETETRATYDRLATALHGTDCSFLGLRTERDHMIITLGGAAEIQPIVVTHSSCLRPPITNGGFYSANVPAPTATHCPTAVAAVRAALNSGSAH